MSDRVPSDCLLSSWMLRNIHEQKWRCLSSFDLRLKADIRLVTVEQQILALVCYVSVALIRKIAKRRRISTFEVTGARFMILHNPT